PIRSARRARRRHFVGIQKPWQRVRGAAGLDDVRIHDLRHSFASIAVSGGDSLYLVGKVLGHRQSRTTERYAHLKDDLLHAVGNRTSEGMAAIMQKVPAASSLFPSAPRYRSPCCVGSNGDGGSIKPCTYVSFRASHRLVAG